MKMFFCFSELMEFLAERVFRPMFTTMETKMNQQTQDVIAKINDLSALVAPLESALNAAVAEEADLKAKLDAATTANAAASAALAEAQAALATAQANALDQATLDALTAASAQLETANAHIAAGTQALSDANAVNASTN